MEISMYRAWLTCFVISLSVSSVYFMYINSNQFRPHGYVRALNQLGYNRPADFENFDNISGTPSGCYIVPNIVHFIRFNQKQLSFIDLVSILAAYKHQRPDQIFIHTNEPNFRGKYWHYLLANNDIRRIITIKLLEIPSEIFGQALSKQFMVFHGGDIARLKILMDYGGIYLDNDSYIVRNMNELRRYEVSIGWREGGNLSNQVIVTHKHSRLLKLWLESYRNSYNSKSWFYNAGIRPTQQILVKQPYLVHREKELLAPYSIIRKIYLENWTEWENLYAVHLYINHMYMLKKNLSASATYPVVFDEHNIKNYPVTIRDMVARVFPLE